MLHTADSKDLLLQAVDTPQESPSDFLPAAAEGSAEPAARHYSQKGQRAMRVMVVDDEPIIADTMATILQKEGFESIAMYGGQAALEASALFQPDVLMTDVMMPEMDGVATAMMMRGRFPKCRIVMFSGHSGATEQLAHVSGGKTAYLLLKKPMRPDDVITVLRGWL